MAETSMNVRGAGQFFGDAHLLSILDEFQREVEADPNKYQQGTLTGLQIQFVAYGVAEIERLHKALLSKYFPDGDAPAIFAAIRDRHQGLWTQLITNAFSTAKSSIEGKTLFGKPSQLVRLIRAIRGLFSKEEEVVKQNTTLQGVTRARTVDGERVVYKINLLSYVKMLYRTVPMNFRREWEQFLVRIKLREQEIKPSEEDEQVFYINTGHSNTSCSTCRACNGRVLTRSALDYATSWLAPPLFHPHCRHWIVPTLVATEKTYNGKYGPVVTIAEIRKWISSGKVFKANRPAPRVVNV